MIKKLANNNNTKFKFVILLNANTDVYIHLAQYNTVSFSYISVESLSSFYFGNQNLSIFLFLIVKYPTISENIE